MKKFQLPQAPKNLSTEGKRFWRAVTEEYDLDDSGLLILRSAMESLDRMRQAQALIEADGLTIKDRFEQPRMHPAILIERDSRAALVKNLKLLGLDLEPLNARPGRPSGR